MLFGELTKGGNVRVKVKNKNLVFEYAKITLLANNEKKGSGKGGRGAGGKKPELV